MAVMTTLRAQPYFAAIASHVSWNTLFSHVRVAIHNQQAERSLDIQAIMREPVQFSFADEVLVTTTRVLCLVLTSFFSLRHRLPGYAIQDGPLASRLRSMVATQSIRVVHDPQAVHMYCQLRNIPVPGKQTQDADGTVWDKHPRWAARRRPDTAAAPATNDDNSDKRAPTAAATTTTATDTDTHAKRQPDVPTMSTCVSVCESTRRLRFRPMHKPADVPHTAARAAIERKKKLQTRAPLFWAFTLATPKQLHPILQCLVAV